MNSEEQEIAQFVADRTGLPVDRAARILKLGEPWPFVKAFGELFSRSFHDADASEVALETALNANVELAKMGVHSLSAESVTQHLEQTVDLTGEEEETVRAVQLALHEFFRLMLEKVRRLIK